MATKDYKAGDVLLGEGAVPKRAYQIIQGSVELTRDVDGMSMPTAVLDRGALIGADELVDGRPMDDTAQALGNLKVEEISKEQAARLLGKVAPKAKKSKPTKAASEKQRDAHSPRALVALSAKTDPKFVEEDHASMVLKPGLLRRILKPDFADVYDRLEVKISVLDGEIGEQASAHLISELNKRRGIRAKAMNAKVSLQFDGDPIAAMRDLKRAGERWLVDNGGDVLVWGAVTEAGDLIHLRFFVRDDKLVDQFRMGDGWTLLVLPLPLDAAAAHRLHATLLAAIRTKVAGKQLTVRRDLEVLLDEAREYLTDDTGHLDPLARAEDQATIARIFANATKFTRRAEDARAATLLLDKALETFSADGTPLEWALAHRDRAFLGQFIAERANDTDALRNSIVDLEAALSVLGPSSFPFDYAALNDRLGMALYRLDFDNGDTATLERSLRAFQDALTVYDKRKTPSEWAEAMGHFGQVALVLGRENRNPRMLLKAIEACNAVVSVRDRKHMPLHWASAQNNLGSALFLYGRISGDSDALRGAGDAFQTARAIYIEKGADRLAGIAEKNLRHVEKALNRKVTEKRPPDLPWEEQAENPPALPREMGPGASGPKLKKVILSKGDTWRYDRLR